MAASPPPPNAAPLGLGDIRSASKATIEGVFGSLGTIPLATDSGYLAALTDASFVSPLPAVEAAAAEWNSLRSEYSADYTLTE